jgi:hypothetical protein
MTTVWLFGKSRRTNSVSVHSSTSTDIEKINYLSAARNSITARYLHGISLTGFTERHCCSGALCQKSLQLRTSTQEISFSFRIKAHVHIHVFVGDEETEYGAIHHGQPTNEVQFGWQRSVIIKWHILEVYRVTKSQENEYVIFIRLKEVSNWSLLLPDVRVL